MKGTTIWLCSEGHMVPTSQIYPVLEPYPRLFIYRVKEISVWHKDMSKEVATGRNHSSRPFQQNWPVSVEEMTMFTANVQRRHYIMFIKTQLFLYRHPTIQCTINSKQISQKKHTQARCIYVRLQNEKITKSLHNKLEWIMARQHIHAQRQRTKNLLCC